MPIPVSRRHKKQKGTVLSETSEIESPHDYKTIRHTEITYGSPLFAETKESPKIPINELEEVSEKCVLDHCISNGSDLIFENQSIDSKEKTQSLSNRPITALRSYHIHCEFCGHPKVIHENHIDYLSDGELHLTIDSGEIYPHKLEVSDVNPIYCKLMDASDNQSARSYQSQKIPRNLNTSLEFQAKDYEKLMSGLKHYHSSHCEHYRVIHGDHIDYLVNGRLEYPHSDHIDDHGPLQMIEGIIVFNR